MGTDLEALAELRRSIAGSVPGRGLRQTRERLERQCITGPRADAMRLYDVTIARVAAAA